MSVVEAAADDLPEISNETYEKIDRWRDALDQTPKIDKRTVFTAAAAELWADAQHHTDLAAVQSIEDSIYVLGEEHAGLDHNDIEFIIVGAKAHANVNGHAAVAKQPIKGSAKHGISSTALPQPLPTPTLLSKAQFLSGFLPPDYLIDAMLQRRFIYALTASTGHGKTALALLIAQLVAARDRRNAFLGTHAVDKGDVVYFAGENPDDLRMRVMAADAKSGHDGSRDRISFIAGTFSIEAMRAECEAKAATMQGGKIDLVIVDTSAAYFSGDEENSNTQMGGHARTLRALTTLPGGPCVLVLCHPIKNASEPSQLLPRGGGAFIAEIDGNLTLWKTGELIELWHTDKMRGPGFEPMTFRLEKILCDALVDAKGRHIPTIRAVAISESDKEAEAKTTRSNEDQILVAMLEPGRPIAALATACGWTLSSGEPHKSKAHRILKGLEKSGLARLHRGTYELTDKGKTTAAKAGTAQ
jgi:hypothetical protein